MKSQQISNLREQILSIIDKPFMTDKRNISHK